MDGVPPAGEIELALDAVGESVCVIDRDWRFTAANRSFAALFGLSPAQVVGRTPFDLNPNFRNSVFYDAMSEVARTREPVARLGHSHSTGRWLMCRAYADGERVVVLINAASDALVEEHQAARLALHDPLTSLPNRIALSRDLRARIAGGAAFGLAFLDLDRFKTVNDTAGHGAGDRVLMALASRMRARARPADRLYRLSGDEFVLVCEPAGAAGGGVDAGGSVDSASGGDAAAGGDSAVDGDAGEGGDAGEDAVREAARLVAAAAEPVAVDEAEFILGASAGVARFPDDGGSADELIRRADMAMYRAKRAGSRAPCRYDPAMEAALQRKLSIERALRQALSGAQFHLEYQPKAALPGARACGAEALLRWRHPELGVVPPGEFLGVAEECGLMRVIDHWVIERAAREVAAFRARGVAVPVSINLSADALMSPETVDRIAAALAAHGLPGGLLEVEITEGALMRDVQASQQVLSRLSDLGLRLSIDDFGTGYSSFAYLLRLRVDTLKIDRAFVREMAASAEGLNVMQGLVTIAHSVGLEVVAEGVETERQQALLVRMGCDQIQGFGFARPMPPERFVRFVRDNHAAIPAGPDPLSI